MPVCDLQTHAGRLQKETKRLRDKWETTKQDWQDQSAKQFEEKFLLPLIPTLQLTLAAVHEFAEIMHDAEQQCGDQGRG